MKWIWLTLVVVACSSTSGAQDYQKIDNEQLKDLMKDENVQLVDVRTPGETDRGIIEGAKIIDFYHPDFMKEIEKLDKSKPVVLYCAVGGRSASASSKLQDAGFVKIYDLKAGIRGWVADGNPLKK